MGPILWDTDRKGRDTMGHPFPTTMLLRVDKSKCSFLCSATHISHVCGLGTLVLKSILSIEPIQVHVGTNHVVKSQCSGFPAPFLSDQMTSAKVLRLPQPPMTCL